MPLRTRHEILKLIDTTAEELIASSGSTVNTKQLAEAIQGKTGMGFNTEYLERELESLGYEIDSETLTFFKG